MSSISTYPVRFSVDYPDRELDRITSAFRIFTLIPIAIVLASIGGYTASWAQREAVPEHPVVAIGGTGLLFLPPLLMIVFRQKYPRWWFDWNLQLLRFANRVGVYFALMDDRYPSTDEEQSRTSRRRLPRRPTGTEPLAAARQVVPRDPALPRTRSSSTWCVVRARSAPGSRSCSRVATRAGSSTTSRA